VDAGLALVAGGSCHGKHPELKVGFPGRAQYGKNWSSFKGYRFVLAMENTAKLGYITEKILNAFASNAIPIYYGSPDVFKVFNRKAFIFYDIRNPKPATDHLARLEANPLQYAKMQREPVFAPGAVDQYLSIWHNGRMRHHILNTLGARRRKITIDVVVPWSGKSSAKNPHATDASRDRNNGEIVYLLRSIALHAPWVRTVWILVNGEVELPESPASIDVRMVNRCTIMPPGTCPTRNSFSAELFSHRIPGLSEQFILVQDDIPLGRPTTSGHFFTNGLPHVWRKSPTWGFFGGKGFHRIYEVPSAVSVQPQPLSSSPCPHYWNPQLKSVLIQLEHTYPAFYALVASHKDGRFSSRARAVSDSDNSQEEDPKGWFGWEYLRRGKAVFKNINNKEHVWWGEIWDMSEKGFTAYARDHPIFMNVNDRFSKDPQVYATQIRAYHSTMEKMFPRPGDAISAPVVHVVIAPIGPNRDHGLVYRWVVAGFPKTICGRKVTTEWSDTVPDSIANADIVWIDCVHVKQNVAMLNAKMHALGLRKPARQKWICHTNEGTAYYPYLISLRADYPQIDVISSDSTKDDVTVLQIGKEYGVTVESLTLPPLVGFASKIPKALSLYSNCNTPSKRENYIVPFIRKHGNLVDNRGHCWGGNSRKNAYTRSGVKEKLDLSRRYMFTFAMENSIIDDRVTEKVFQALAVGSIPIYKGAPNAAKDIIPCHACVIWADDYPTPDSLAAHLTKIIHNETLYNQYMAWKKSPRADVMDMLRMTTMDSAWCRWLDAAL